ncbi:MAG: dihydroorotate dehydrogenase [Actinomycetota bacterium]|nr:dihydroorotate dehydrogenase [Actinomycetota bacterium]
MDLSIELAGIHLRSPIVLASGTAGYAYEYDGIIDFSYVGAVIIKTVTMEPRSGHPEPRIWEVTAGVLNSIGLENIGIDALLSDVVPHVSNLDVPVIASIAAETAKGFARLASRIEEAGVFCALELNISCPNVERGGLEFGVDPKATSAVVSAVRENTSIPVFPKLSSAVTNIREIAEAAYIGGASGLSLINTIPGLAVDVASRRARLGGITGGLSGPAIKPIALKAVWDCYQATGLPIIGGGGVYDVQDVLEFMICGARAVSVGTATFQDPQGAGEIVEALPSCLEELGVDSPSRLVGTLET